MDRPAVQGFKHWRPSIIFAYTRSTGPLESQPPPIWRCNEMDDAFKTQTFLRRKVRSGRTFEVVSYKGRDMQRQSLVGLGNMYDCGWRRPYHHRGATPKTIVISENKIGGPPIQVANQENSGRVVIGGFPPKQGEGPAWYRARDLTLNRFAGRVVVCVRACVCMCMCVSVSHSVAR
jgi:hypothetical protein